MVQEAWRSKDCSFLVCTALKKENNMIPETLIQMKCCFNTLLILCSVKLVTCSGDTAKHLAVPEIIVYGSSWGSPCY